jgi:hypothetical protein
MFVGLSFYSTPGSANTNRTRKQIIPYLRKHGTDPVTGKKLSSGDLLPLNFAKNADGSSRLLLLFYYHMVLLLNSFFSA